MKFLHCWGYVLRLKVLIPVFTHVRNNSITMKYLNVAEKNDAAKNIALHLSRGTSRRREGLSQYNKIYEFEAEVQGQKCQMVMTSVSGHLLSMEFVGAFKNWQACEPLRLFDVPVFKYCPDNYDKIKKTLEREVRSCTGLIIWTDCDREGENIGFEIIEVCTTVKSNLRIFRAKFSEITSVSVRRALQNLEQPNKNISNAVDVRQELDLRIGAAFTRFQTLRLQRVFPRRLANSLVSYGSCQFPTLGFVVDRYRAIEQFIPEDFWEIIVCHTMNNLCVKFTWDRVRLFDEVVSKMLFETVLDNSEAKVYDIKTKPKSKWRPLPLDTVELEKLASRKLKINAKETMRLAEKLYTQGFISYPRTETNQFPKEMNLGQLVGLHTGDPNWGPFAQQILDSGGPTPRQGNKSDQAHPPIHPTKYTNSLSGNEQRLYEFIVRSFLACCSKDAQGQETKVSIDVANEKFSARGLMITARNYLEVYPYDKWSSKEIHVYQEGQTFLPTSVDLNNGETTPPNLLTEADLIALMEKHGIGTDATHADHIETLKNRSYIALGDAVHFVPGVLGMGLVEGYDAMGLAITKPELRAQLEADLKAISDGRKQPQQVLAEQIAKYKEVYIVLAAEANKMDSALELRLSEQPIEYTPESMNLNMPSVMKCPKCGSGMLLRQKRNIADEFFIGCMSYPNCKNAVWFPAVVKKVEVLPDSCATCGPNNKKIKFLWRNNTIDHLYPPPYIGCVGGCDTDFLELLRINLSSVRNVSERTRNTNNNQNTNNTRNTNNNQNTNNTRNTNNNQNTNNNHNTIDNSTNSLNRGSNSSSNLNNIANQSTVAPVRQTAPQVNQRRTFQPPPPANRSQNENGNDGSTVMCGCNKPAILLTVRKQNANFGKKFYKCDAGKDRNSCNFFLWADSDEGQNQSVMPNSNLLEDPEPFGNGTTMGWGIAPSTSTDTFQSNDDDVKCNCGLPCKKIIVHKEGPNKGRPFYGCPKDFSQRCNFFQWGDEDGTVANWGNSSNTTYSSRNRGRSRRGRGRGRARASNRRGISQENNTRRCGLCRQEGHTRGRCPNNDS